jgi:hypothetical protein
MYSLMRRKKEIWHGTEEANLALTEDTVTEEVTLVLAEETVTEDEEDTVTPAHTSFNEEATVALSERKCPWRKTLLSYSCCDSG